jgi:MoxR-like ATPase
MEQDKFLRKVKGKLPEAHIAFIDEIYKCNEPTLNILLPLLNERIFFNDGKAIKVPLISMVAASNEEPDDDSLKALHDRLVFRTVVQYVKEPGNRMKMHQNFVNELNGATAHGTKTKVTLEELEAIREMSKKLPVAPNVYKVFARLLGVLEKNGIVVSDRRQNECYRIMQGNALYFGRNQVVLDDLNALKSVLWEQQKDIPFVSQEIDKLVNPFDDEMANLWKKANEVISNISKITNQNDRCGASIEAKQRLENIIKKMNTVIRDAQANGKDVTEYTKKRDTIVAENQKLVQEAIGLNLSDLGINLGGNMPF